MIVYEVNLWVQAARAEEARVWLRQHINHMLALPGFSGARSFEIAEPIPSGEIGLCTQYELRDQAALDSYLLHHAEQMRSDGLARFGQAMRSQRRVLRPVSAS